jgi:hypothetical protein
MNGKSAYTVVPPSVRAVQDEWGMFDPNQAGLEAAFRAVRALDEGPAIGGAAFDATDDDQAVKSKFIASVERPSRPSRDQHAEQRGSGPTRIVPPVTAPDETVYDLTDPGPRPRHPCKPAERGAVYTLEFSTRCPQCCTEINTVRVSRLLRTQVSFTSTLPRKGYIIVCPACDGILSAELSGLI